MSQFDTTGSGDLPVGPVRIHLDTACDHNGRDVCRTCTGFTDEEMAALRKLAIQVQGEA